MKKSDLKQVYNAACLIGTLTVANLGLANTIKACFDKNAQPKNFFAATTGLTVMALGVVLTRNQIGRISAENGGLKHVA